jgi:hypothetical protein
MVVRKGKAWTAEGAEKIGADVGEKLLTAKGAKKDRKGREERPRQLRKD